MFASSSKTLVSVSALAALWSASRGIFGMLTGLNRIYGVQEDRGYVFTRLLSLVYTFLFLLVLLLTLLVGEQTYNGAGDAVIRRMLAGETISEAFLLKLVFTALTLGAGFRGGEIVPVLFTGAAFGTVVGPLLGLSQSFGGALGMTAVFCGATNCPITSILLAYELFTSRGLPLYALCCAISYMLSGYYGLYSEQKIIYSKFKATWVDRKAE